MLFLTLSLQIRYVLVCSPDGSVVLNVVLEDGFVFAETTVHVGYSVPIVGFSVELVHWLVLDELSH
jgi:hypothetical protein